VALSLNNLAALYHATGRYAEAEPLYKRALAIREKALGPDHPHVAQSLNNLALLYKDTGRYGEAEPLYKRTLAIDEKALGPNHPSVATSLNNLALLYDDTGRYAQAEPFYKLALSIWEKALGPDHPDVANSLNNLATLYAETNRHAESHSLFLRAQSIEATVREETFLVLNELQQLAYMRQKEWSLHLFLYHTAQYLRSQPNAVAATLDAWLQWKGTVMEAQGRYQEAVTRSDDPQVQSKFDALNKTRRALGTLQLSRPETMPLDTYKERLAELRQQKETLEVELGRLSKDFSLERLIGRADSARLASLLPVNSVYVDFARIEQYDFKNREWGDPRYLAFVLIPKKTPQVHVIDLGDAEVIETHVRAYRTEMDWAKEGMLPDAEVLKREAGALYQAVMTPLAPYLEGIEQLLISPDGSLNLVPFEVMVAAGGNYLIEEPYTISYVGAGRDIVRLTDTTAPAKGALILADPDYNLGAEEKTMVLAALKMPTTIRGATTRDFSGLAFTPLPDTKDEANTIETLLQDRHHVSVTNCQHEKALEEVLFSTSAPGILHLATHGYFLEDQDLGPPRKLGDLGEGLEALPDPRIENPMLRSGLALAGANISLKEGRDDGLVSAEKILGLRLKGTALVVLSACETGVGKVNNGEGVFGLKRAFILAGAKTLVMSLWSVPSAETAELMTAFYTRLSRGIPKAQALRDAKRAMMKKKPHPFYWGAFVLTGNPS
jgi:CHAT domain-containing protein/tetratricopeptide (TPR) repeat protein